MVHDDGLGDPGHVGEPAWIAWCACPRPARSYTRDSDGALLTASYRVDIKFNKKETKKAAWSFGAMSGFLGLIQSRLPGRYKVIVEVLRYFVWEFATVAGYAVLTNKCLQIRMQIVGFRYPYGVAVK